MIHDDDGRYQKALEAGCIPVVVSDKVTLPFESLKAVDNPLLPLLNWSDAVIRYLSTYLPTITYLPTYPPTYLPTLKM